jgi:hypothetical protein
VYLRANLGSSYVSQFLLTNTEMRPSDITAEKLPLWHSLNERIQTLNKFIDELKKVSAVVPPMRKQHNRKAYIRGVVLRQFYVTRRLHSEPRSSHHYVGICRSGGRIGSIPETLKPSPLPPQHRRTPRSRVRPAPRAHTPLPPVGIRGRAARASERSGEPRAGDATRSRVAGGACGCRNVKKRFGYK